MMSSQDEEAAAFPDTMELSLPSRSQVYSVVPMHMGTALAESLTSYLIRLAEAHSVRMGDFYRLLARHPSASAAVSSRPLCTLSRSGGAVSGTGQVASEMVQVLQAMTLRTDLIGLTLLNWAHILSDIGLMRAKKAWCPLCYEDARIQHQVIYDPLLWYLQITTICPAHCIPLQQQCFRCRSTMPWIAANARLGFCLKCGAWLGHQRDDLPLYSVSEIAEALHDQSFHEVGVLIAYAGRGTSPEATQVFQLVNNICAVANKSVKDIGNLTGIGGQSIGQVQKGRTLLALGSMLRLTHYANISFLHILEPDGMLDAIRQRPFTNKKAAKKSLDKHHIQQYMHQVIEDEIPIPLEEVARQQRCTSEALRYIDRDLAKQIVVRFRIYQQAQRAEEIQQTCAQVRETIFALHRQGKAPRYAVIQKGLQKPGRCIHPEVKAAIKEARDEVGYE